MDGHIASCWCSRGRTSCKFQLASEAIFQHIGHCTHIVLTGVPSTLIKRLFLAPHNVFYVGIALQRFQKERGLLADGYPSRPALDAVLAALNS